jgi:receptor protein-tyrosine kinase
VLGLLLGGSLALGLSLAATPLYTSQTQLFVSTTGSASAMDALQGSQFSQQRVSSYAELLGGVEVAARVIDDLGLTDVTPDELAGQVSATPVTDTVLINIDVTDPSAERARDIAASIGAEFPQLVAELEGAGSDEGSPVTVTVTRPAELPGVPSSPMTVRDSVMGALLGVVLGLALALLRAQLDRSVRDPDEAAALAGAPVIGMILKDDSVEAQHVADGRSSSGAGEGYRQLRSNLQYLNVDEPPKVIMLSSAIPAQGKSTAAVNLGIALAQAGRRVTVIEADLRKPMVARYLGLIEGAGLTSILTGTADLDDVLQPWGDGKMSVIAAGPVPPNPGELLASSHMRELLDELRDTNDYVLIDTPPLLPVADGTGVSVMVDGVLLSVRYGGTTKDQLRQVRATLDRVGATTLGVILNLVPQRSEVTAAFGYQYTYDYRPQRPAIE